MQHPRLYSEVVQTVLKAVIDCAIAETLQNEDKDRPSQTMHSRQVATSDPGDTG